jgi:hypothetical protein
MDVTAAKHAEEKIQQSESELRQILELASCRRLCHPDDWGR